jgi:hypothetical protein
MHQESALMGMGTDRPDPLDRTVGREIADGRVAGDQDEVTVLTATISGAGMSAQQLFRIRRRMMQDTRDGFALAAQSAGKRGIGVIGQALTRRDQSGSATGIPDRSVPHFLISPIILHRCFLRPFPQTSARLSFDGFPSPNLSRFLPT